MPSKKRNLLVDQWREDLEKSLLEMARSWSNLAGPLTELIKLLKAAGPGGSFTVTKELIRKLDKLQQVIVGGAPVPPRRYANCLRRPPKPRRTSTIRKRRLT